VTFAFSLTSDPASRVAPRTGIIRTPHGVIETPVFMPVGTLATVKSLHPAEVRAAGATILLVNAYHLYLRPGHRQVASLGGVHRFMRWDGPILSDSGGFQAMSLGRLGKVTEEGFRVRSHLDGSAHLFSPELAMEIQSSLGVDIAMPLDHLLPAESSHTDFRSAGERTLRWYQRCCAAAPDTTTFGIVQGGVFRDLRAWHARALSDLGPPGFGIGGLSVGEPKPVMWEMTEAVNEELPVDRPRYLMGVGSPEDLVESVARGVDMFDCVLPTRLGRNGALFTADGRVSIRNARFASLDEPLDPDCELDCCRLFSAAYLHHLFRNGELLGHRLASMHNIRFLTRLMERTRAAIAAGTFDSFARDFLDRYRTTDQSVRAAQRARWLAKQAAPAN